VGAQGIDAEEQRARCSELGLQLGQGALAGSAVSAGELANLFGAATAS